MNEIEFEAFPKLARLSREMTITEKIDGTNAQIIITEDGQLGCGSRTRLITPEVDNYGFARWAYANKDALIEALGPGRHFGEWWGSGIQRGYGLKEKRFSLFNTDRWAGVELPEGVDVVPVLYCGMFDTGEIQRVLDSLREYGSRASLGYMNPEGVVIWHDAARVSFKKTIHKDESPKGFVRP